MNIATERPLTWLSFSRFDRIGPREPSPIWLIRPSLFKLAGEYFPNSGAIGLDSPEMRGDGVTR